MMRKENGIIVVSIVLLFFVFSITLWPVDKIKKLESALPNISGKEKIENLSELAEFYSRKDPKKAIELGNEALLLLETFPDNKLRISILISLGWSYKNIGEYKRSLECSRKSLKLSEEIGDDKLKARSLNLVGINYILTAKYADSLNCFVEAVNIFRLTGDKKEIASTLNNIGIAYDMTGSYESALNYYLQSLKIKEELGELTWIASSLNNIGVIYKLIDFPDKAIQYFERALEINRKLNKNSSIAITLTNIGIMYYQKADYSTAMKYYSDALRIDEELGNKRGISNSLNNIGLTLFGMGKPEEAMAYYTQALKIRKKLGDKKAIVRTLLNIAEVNRASGFLKEAIQTLKIVIEKGNNINAKSEMASAYEALYKIYEKRKNTRDAFDYLRKFQILNKEIVNNKAREKVLEIEKRNQMENKEKEIEILKKNKLIQQMTIRRQQFIKNVFFAGAFFLLIGVLILFYLYRSKKRINNELEVVNKKLDKSARTDPLTGLSNRRDMYEKITYELNRISRIKESFSLVICDIDDFKLFNDKHGHDCGDFILEKLAKYLSSLIRKQDTIGRWGGEEFLILLPETTLEGAVKLSEKIRKDIASKLYDFNGTKFSLTLTFGVCSYDREMEWSECLKSADDALYRGKKAGKNCVVAGI